MTKISCIIPAYNEGSRIGNVLDVVLESKIIDEVVAINDGSSDNTLAVIQSKSQPKLKIISHENHGKSYTVMTGLKQAKNEFVMMIDADLVGLTLEHIEKLAEPVISGRADMSMSIRKNSLFIYRFFGMDFVSGERVFNKKVIDNLDTIGTLPGFGLETFLNNILISKHLRLSIVMLNGLITPRKNKKVGFWEGELADVKMIQEILAVTPFWKLVISFWKLKRLQVK